MKKIIKIAFVAAFAAIAGYGVYTSQKSNMEMSDLAMANVEALANDESNCHNTNGYTAFTNRGGGAYDCCYIWVSKAPNTSEGHCR